MAQPPRLRPRPSCNGSATTAASTASAVALGTTTQGVPLAMTMNNYWLLPSGVMLIVMPRHALQRLTITCSMISSWASCVSSPKMLPKGRRSMERENKYVAVPQIIGLDCIIFVPGTMGSVEVKTCSCCESSLISTAKASPLFNPFGIFTTFRSPPTW